MKRLMLALFAGAGCTLADAQATAQAQPARRNVFNDPFVVVTRGLPACPVPEGPLYSDEQAQAAAHDRSQRGVSCHLAGRCRLPNAYLYDQEIIPRVQIAVAADGGFAGTSVWALGQRRVVWLKGCVVTAAQVAALEQLVRRIDDVEGVVLELMVGVSGAPPYAPARP